MLGWINEPMNQPLQRLNELSSSDAQAEFLKCCGATRWAQQMEEMRPFANVAELLSRADQLWWSLDEAGWLEAFRAHPKIGEQKAATAQSAQAAGWSAQEQSGMAHASAPIISELAQRNREYEDRFGFIFIVCATGKSSEEMLSIIKSRLQNDNAAELHNAAEEQRKITRLRLEKLLGLSPAV
jgi:OHCU decarboxylase